MAQGHNSKKSARKPISKRLRFEVKLNGGYYRPDIALQWIKAAHSWGIGAEEIRTELLSVSSWSQFDKAIDALIARGKQRAGQE